MKKYKDLDELAADTDKQGGTAFPARFEMGGISHAWHGMTLRDYFAAHAPQDFLHLAEFSCKESGPPNDPYPEKGNGYDYILWKIRQRVRTQYAYADAMLAERNTPNES